MEKSITSKLKEVFIPSLLTGGISVGIYLGLYNGSMFAPIPFGGLDIPASLAVALSTTAGNMIGEIGSEFILPYIPGNSYSGAEGMILKPALSGLANYLVMRTAVSDQVSMLPSLVTGAGGSIAANYIYENMVPKVE